GTAGKSCKPTQPARACAIRSVISGEALVPSNAPGNWRFSPMAGGGCMDGAIWLVGAWIVRPSGSVSRTSPEGEFVAGGSAAPRESDNATMVIVAARLRNDFISASV